MSQFHERVKRSIVFIGKKEGELVIPSATGFLVLIEKIFHLVTAKHVVYDEDTNEFLDEDLYVIWNSIDGGLRTRSLINIGETLGVSWVFHPNNNVDIAVIAFLFDPNVDDLNFIPDNLFMPPDQLFELDEVFFVGYQPNIKFEGKTNPIFRMGMISSKNQDGSFYIDGAAFPGNSGSPVFLRPSPMRFNKEQDRYEVVQSELGGSLIGVISGYIPYQEVAVSQQTKRPRIIFEENTGLSIVWSAQQLQEIIRTSTFQEHLEFIKTEHADKSYNPET